MPKIQLRQDISSVWQSKNPVLLLGEFGVETDTNKFKIGDGVTDWNNLSYSVPTKTSDLVNDSGYINISAVPTTLSQLINDSGYVTSSALNDKQDVLIAGSNITIENNVISAIGSGGSSSVNSVNGKVGTVVLSAHDVGALPDSTFIPVKTSDIVNDSGFITLTSVNNGTVTINQGGVQKGTFTLNQSGNATIDLDAGVTVDQTFDGTSQNAQSGVAIQGELSTNYQSKLVSGTNIKTVNNTSLLGSGNIDIQGGLFIASYNTTEFNDILSAYQNGKNVILVGGNTIATLSRISNTYAEFCRIDNHASTARFLIFTRCDNQNVWTESMMSLLDRSLSNLDATGQAVIDGKVSKSGDTMTGALNLDMTTVGSSNENFQDITFTLDDINRAGLRCSHSTDGTNRVQIIVRNNSGTFASGYEASNNNGTLSCSFPDTTCVDGQWQFINTVIMDNVSVTGSSNLTYTLSDVPDDGHMYEVMLTGNVETGTTSGNFCTLQLRSDFSTGAVTRICNARTRSSSYMQAQGTVIIPLTSSRKIYVSRNTGWVGTANLWLIGYRRIGTNN